MEQDTVRLLRECDAGIKMGVSSINEVLDHVKSEGMGRCLARCRGDHEALGNEIQTLLARAEADGKEPAPLAKGMSWIKTNVMLAADESDATVADLITDGCNMGVKSLTRYLNQYRGADEKARDAARRLIEMEQALAADLRPWL